MRVLISVIIPVYNTEKYLAECLDSIIRQSLREIEIICVNDASTDSSLHILQEYASKDGRISIISYDKNKGQAYARNLGIKNAIGKYIYFVDSDDMLKENSLNEMLDLMERDSLQCLLFDADVIYDCKIEEIFKTNTIRSCHYPNISNGGDMFVTLRNNDDYDVTVWRQIWNRQYLIEHGLIFHIDTSPHEDVLFTFEALLMANKIRCINKSFYIYRRREGASTACNINVKRLSSYIIVYLEMHLFLSGFTKTLSSRQMMCIKTYLSMRRKMLDRFIVELYWQGVTLDDVVWRNDIDRLMFCLYWNKYDYINEQYAIHVLRKSQIYDYVIVYGAGIVAEELIDLMRKYHFPSPFIAVTKIDVNTNLKIKDLHEISSLTHIADKSLVIVATTRIYWSEMTAILEKQGFRNYDYILE